MNQFIQYNVQSKHWYWYWRLLSQRYWTVNNVFETNVFNSKLNVIHGYDEARCWKDIFVNWVKKRLTLSIASCIKWWNYTQPPQKMHVVMKPLANSNLAFLKSSVANTFENQDNQGNSNILVLHFWNGRT